MSPIQHTLDVSGRLAPMVEIAAPACRHQCRRRRCTHPRRSGLAPVDKPIRGYQVCHARILVADIGGEEFPEPLLSVVGADEQDQVVPTLSTVLICVFRKRYPG